MPNKKEAPVSTKKPGVAKFHPGNLTVEQQEQVIEFYLGVHPQFLIISHDNLKIDVWNIAHNGKHFEGFFPNQRKLGKTDEDIEKQRGKLGY